MVVIRNYCKGKITLSITWTTPFSACMSTNEVIILLTRLFGSVNVKSVVSAVIFPPKVATGPEVN